jgi:hypothetical protein
MSISHIGKMTETITMTLIIQMKAVEKVSLAVSAIITVVPHTLAISFQ